MKLTPRALAKKTGSGLFSKEGWFAPLDARTVFWGHSGACWTIDLESGEKTALGVPGVKYPTAVVASPDGAQVAILERGGWVRVVTLTPGKKPKAKRARLHPRLPLSGAGFSAQHLVLRSAYPDDVATLHDRATLAKVGTVKSKHIAGLSAAGAALEVDTGTALWLPGAAKATPVAKHALHFLGSTADGATLLTVDDTHYVTVDATSGKVLARLKQDTLKAHRDDRVLPFDGKHLVRLHLERPTSDVEEVTLEVWSLAGKQVATRSVTFDARKKSRGLAEQVVVTPTHLVLNSETIIDIG